MSEWIKRVLKSQMEGAANVDGVEPPWMEENSMGDDAKMGFTDEELARLKEWLDDEQTWAPSLVRDDLVGLLARLAAAERCLTPSTDYCLTCHCEDCESKREAWLRACGEGE